MVARYNEDVNWTTLFQRVLIYNKGEPLENRYQEIRLPNVVKEGHTYYNHICENYDTLADYTIFLQGNPFDHFPTVIEHIQHFIEETPYHIQFEYICNRAYCCNLSGCKFHQDLPLIDVYEYLFEERKQEMPFTFYRGAQFILSKERIRKRPKSFYEKIVQLLNKEVNPVEGYVMERFHQFVFK